MNSKFFPILLVAAVLLVAGCAQKQQTGKSGTSGTEGPAMADKTASPAITFTSPAAGATVSGPDMALQFSVSNLKIVAPPADGKNVAGQGHLHGYLDDGQYIPIADTSYTAKGLSAGKHKFRLELQNNDHTLLSPKVMKEIEFTVSGGAAAISAPATGPTPEITFNWPTDGGSDPGPDVSLKFSVSNFQVQAPKDTNEAGKGHLHGYLDDGTYIPIADSMYAAKGLAPGKHKFRLELQNNDHTLVSPKVMKEISFTVGSSASTTTPAITFTSPTEGSTVTGADQTVAFSVSNFQVQAPKDTNEAGKGHLHGFLDGGQYIPIAATSYKLTGLTSGAHKFKLVLQNNDHTAYAPATTKELSFTVTGGASGTTTTSTGGGY